MCDFFCAFRISVKLTGSAPKNIHTSNHSMLTTTALQAELPVVH